MVGSVKIALKKKKEGEKKKDFWILKKLFTAVVQRSARMTGCDKCTALSTSLPAWNSALHCLPRTPLAL